MILRIIIPNGLQFVRTQSLQLLFNVLSSSVTIKFESELIRILMNSRETLIDSMFLPSDEFTGDLLKLMMLIPRSSRTFTSSFVRTHH